MCWLLFPLLVYIVLLGWVSQTFRRLQHGSTLSDIPPPDITVVIAARNEALNLGHVLSDLMEQSVQNFEIMVVNDHSEDETCEVVKGFPNVVLVHSKGVGKKAALTTAMSLARGSIILVTDADCRLGKDWVRSMSDPFAKKSVGMVCGPVKIQANSGLLNDLQILECHSLIVLGAFFIGIRKPFFCNAACMAFRKATFHEVGGYTGNESIPSGDDEFLMHKITKQSEIYFQAVRDAMVVTRPCENLSSYIHQRIRWASKHGGYQEIYKLTTLFLFGFVNLMVLVFPILWTIFGPMAVAIPIIKMLADGAFAHRHASYFETRISKFNLPLLICFYPWLLLVIVTRKKYMWKGRQLS